MHSHPFTDEDIDYAARKAKFFWDEMGQKNAWEDMVQALWDSAVNRGAVGHGISIDDVPYYTINKLPEKKT